MTMPSQLQAGDRLQWDEELADYPAAAGWELVYALRGPQELEIVASGSDTTYSVDIAPATSAQYQAGEYAYQAYARQTVDGSVTDRVTLESGTVRVLPDLATAGPSQAKQTLDAIDAMLARRATKAQESYSVNGRALKYFTWDELMKTRRFYVQLYRQELQAAGIATSTSGVFQVGLR